MEQIQSYFGVGYIYNQGSNAVQFNVKSIKKLEAVIKHFDRYPLITQKQADYLLFREVVLMMLKKEHLTQEGLEKIVALKANLNLGLSDQLKAAFPDVVPIKRPLVVDQVIRDPQ